jgi:superkiller protein 3
MARTAEIHPLDRAIAELRNEQARTPDEPTLFARLGALYYRRGDLLNAETQYRKALERLPGRPSYLNNLGNILCDLGRFQEGIQYYEQAIAIIEATENTTMSSNEARANLELARLESRLIHERIAYFEQAVNLNVESAEALNALGGGYLLRNDRVKAITAFRSASKLDPRNLAAALNIGFTHTLELAGPNDLTGALSELATFTVRFPGEARLHLHQGELLESSGLWDEAEEKYRRALQADPRCLEAYDLLGRLRDALGEETDDRSSALVGALTAKLMQVRQPRSAAEHLDLAIGAIALRKYAGATSFDEGIDTLLRESLRLVECTPDVDRGVMVKAAVLRAQLLEADGRRDEALLVLDTWSEKLPGSGRLWFERASLAFRSGEIEKAVEAFERATLAEPQEAYAYHSLRFAFEAYRRYRTQRLRFEAAIKSQPNDAVAHQRFALAALGVLKDDEALFHFSRALELDPRFADAAFGRGKTLQKQGHFQEAEQAFRKALQMDPGHLEARQALQTIESLMMRRETDSTEIFEETR